MAKKRKRWKVQEAKLASSGFRKTPASGAGVIKGDAKSDEYLVSAKHTVSKQFSLKLSDLTKMWDDAVTEDRVGVMQVSIGPGEQKFAVLRWEDLCAIVPNFPSKE